MYDFYKALLAGFLASLPLGPVGALVFRSMNAYKLRGLWLAVCAVVVSDLGILLLISNKSSFITYAADTLWMRLLIVIIPSIIGIYTLWRFYHPKNAIKKEIALRAIIPTIIIVNVTNPFSYIGIASITFLTKSKVTFHSSLILLGYVLGVLLLWNLVAYIYFKCVKKEGDIIRIQEILIVASSCLLVATSVFVAIKYLLFGHVGF